MITMEFDELKKVWDAQNNELLYGYNEETLRKRIFAKSRRARFVSNVNEIGLIAISVIVCGILLFKGSGSVSVYNYFTALAMLLAAIYVYRGRILRKRIESTFDRSMLGELDQAIANTSNEAIRAKTFVWWYLLPISIPTFVKSIQTDTSFWELMIIPFAFILAFSVVRWELKRVHIPRKRNLETLRAKLVEEVEDLNNKTD